jgi:release factor glutamine methyltransferase
MQSIGEAARWGTRELEQAGIGSATLDAQLLLCHVLGRDRIYVIAHPEQPLEAASAAAYASLIRRRASGEPHQYLVGTQEFYGRPFEVSSAVLIPRPETELLVERAVELVRMRGPCARVVDVGTGSGCIVVTLACECPGISAVATDISLQALTVARRNALRHIPRQGVILVACDLLDAFPARPLFDVVVSNPPYVARRDTHTMAPTVKDHEPHTALFAGETGLDVIERLIPQARARLRPGGWLLLELGVGQAPTVREIVSRLGFELVDTLTDLQGIARCLVARRAVG